MQLLEEIGFSAKFDEGFNMSDDEGEMPTTDPNSRAGTAASGKKRGLMASEDASHGPVPGSPDTPSSPRTNPSSPGKSPGKRISSLSQEEEGTVKELLYQCQKNQRDADTWKQRFEALQLRSDEKVRINFILMIM